MIREPVRSVRLGIAEPNAYDTGTFANMKDKVVPAIPSDAFKR